MGGRVRQPGHRCTARSRASPGSLPQARPAAPALCERLTVISESRVEPAAVAWGLRPTPSRRPWTSAALQWLGGACWALKGASLVGGDSEHWQQPVRGRVPLPGACRGAPALGRAGAGRIVRDANDLDATEACGVGSAHSPVPSSHRDDWLRLCVTRRQGPPNSPPLGRGVGCPPLGRTRTHR